MEDHLTNKDRLQKEWDTLCAYDAEPCSVVAAIEPTNMRKNRFTDILPCMHCSLLTTHEAAWYRPNFGRVCLSVCLYVRQQPSKAFRRKFTFALPVYLKRIRVKFVYEMK